MKENIEFKKVNKENLSNLLEKNNIEFIDGWDLYNMRGKDMSFLETLNEEKIKEFFNDEVMFDTLSIENTNSEKVKNIAEFFLENGKNPGSEIKQLQDKGITGKDIHVAISDHQIKECDEFNFVENTKKVFDENREMKNSILDDELEVGYPMHGNAVSSLLCGKESGVAKDSILHFYSAQQGSKSFFDEIYALNKIVKYNENQNELKDKIRILSLSKGYGNQIGLEEYKKTKKEAEESGLIIIDVNNLSKHCLGGRFESVENRDENLLIESLSFKNQENDFEDYRVNFLEKFNEMKKNDEENLIKLFKERLPDNLFKNIDKEGGVDDIVKYIYNEKKEALEKKREKTILISIDNRTYSSVFSGDNGFEYQAKGGISWAEPWLSGLFAMALQIDENLNQKQLFSFLKKTSIRKEKGFLAPSPIKFIEEIKKNKSL